MENYKEKYEALLTQFEQYKKESIKWSKEDILTYVEDYYQQMISEEEAQAILEKMIRMHDANIGITWDTLEYHIDDHFGLHD